MKSTKKTPPLNENRILEAVLEEGTRRFSKAQASDRNLYGKLHGRDDLIAFAKYIDPKFEDPWHVRAIRDALMRVERRETKRLIINMPPRHGKSHFTTEIYPAWRRGRRPDEPVIVSSYSASKASDFTRFQRDTCESPFFTDIFPDVSVRPDRRAAEAWETNRGGVTIGAGVGGAITGRGADLGIIDDPVKDYEEAISERMQEKIWDWYRSTFLTRMHPGGAIILIMTRWMKNDLAGRLLDLEGTTDEGGKWELLKLPAISAKGEALWPERYSYDDLMEIRGSLGEKIFQALYQQEPVDITERLFDNPKFEEPADGVRKIAYLDPAFGGSDYSAYVVGGTKPSEDGTDTIYVTMGAIWKGQIDETYNRVEKLHKASGAGTLYVESNQAQIALIPEFRRRGITVRDVRNISNKHLRIVNSVKVNWDRIRFSKAVSEDFLKQLCNYSELALHDDAPDALAGLIEHGRFGNSLDRRYNGFFSIFGR